MYSNKESSTTALYYHCSYVLVKKQNTLVDMLFYCCMNDLNGANKIFIIQTFQQHSNKNSTSNKVKKKDVKVSR